MRDTVYVFQDSYGSLLLINLFVELMFPEDTVLK